MVPLPIIGANPTTGFVRVFARFYATLGDRLQPPCPRRWVYPYTTNRQFVSGRATVFFENDRYVMLSDIRFALNSQPTYGLGTNPEYAYKTSPEMMAISVMICLKKCPEGNDRINQIRFYNTLFKRIEETRFLSGLATTLTTCTDSGQCE